MHPGMQDGRPVHLYDRRRSRVVGSVGYPGRTEGRAHYGQLLVV